MNKEFWQSALIRAVRTIAQTALGIIIGAKAMTLGDVNWQLVVSASILSGIISVLTSIATGLPEAEYSEHIYMSAEEPEDSEVYEDGEE